MKEEIINCFAHSFLTIDSKGTMIDTRSTTIDRATKRQMFGFASSRISPEIQAESNNVANSNPSNLSPQTQSEYG